jgi:hypothetical protein
MKPMTYCIVFLVVALATPVIFGGEPPRGVAQVDVIVRQKPRDSAVTDARGNFAIEALAAGNYTLTFRARKADDLHHSTPEKVIVAMAYSIKIEGAKRAVRKSNLTSDDLLAGVDVVVPCGPGARITGQVASNVLKNMIWITQELGSSLPGHWVAEDSPEAKLARHHNAHAVSREGIQVIQR